jgi:hypothetical protein
MNDKEATLFALMLAALNDDNENGAKKGLIENTETTTASCTVERSK